MPTIELDTQQITALQRILRDAGYNAPDEEPPNAEEWVYEKKQENPDVDPSVFVEDYPYDTADQRVLYDILEACTVCGNPECDRGTAYVGASEIHADQHPENQSRAGRGF